MLTSDRRHWKVRLPTDLRRANILAFDVVYSDGGEAEFWAGLRAR